MKEKKIDCKICRQHHSSYFEASHAFSDMDVRPPFVSIPPPITAPFVFLIVQGGIGLEDFVATAYLSCQLKRAVLTTADRIPGSTTPKEAQEAFCSMYVIGLLHRNERQMREDGKRTWLPFWRPRLLAKDERGISKQRFQFPPPWCGHAI
jgi:hypothetical protein